MPPPREIQIHHRLNIPRNAYVKPTQMITQRMSSVYRHRLQLLRTFYSSRPRKKDKCRACPCVIEKALHGIAGVPKTKKKLRSGDLLVECVNKIHADNLLRTKMFFDLPVTVSLHSSLNICKGQFSDLRGSGRVVRWCWINFQCRGVLQFGLQ